MTEVVSMIKFIDTRYMLRSRRRRGSRYTPLDHRPLFFITQVRKDYNFRQKDQQEDCHANDKNKNRQK